MYERDRRTHGEHREPSHRLEARVPGRTTRVEQDGLLGEPAHHPAPHGAPPSLKREREREPEPSDGQPASEERPRKRLQLRDLPPPDALVRTLKRKAELLETTSYQHLRPEAEPLVTEGLRLAKIPRREPPARDSEDVHEIDAMPDPRLANVMSRLDSIFTLHLAPSATGEPDAKRRSVEHHAELGERVIAKLLAPPPPELTPFQVLELRRREAAELEELLASELEEPVVLRVRLPEPSAVISTNAIRIEISIAPNDWFAVITLVATVFVLGGTLLWAWSRDRGSAGERASGSDGSQDASRTRSTEQQPDDGGPILPVAELPVAIRGLPNLGNDCFLDATLQVLAAAYPALLTAERDVDVDIRTYLRTYVSEPIDPRHVQPLRQAVLAAEDPDYEQLVDAAPLHDPGQRDQAIAALTRIRRGQAMHQQIQQELAQLLGQIDRSQPGPIRATAVKELRAGLLQHRPRLVESLHAQEDAQELMNAVLAEFLDKQGNQIGMHQTLTITASKPRAQVNQARHPEHEHELMQYVASDAEMDAPAQTFSHALEDDSMLKVPLDGGQRGLVEYLHEVLGDGSDEVFAEGSEWARTSDDEVVAVTGRNVKRTFTALPPVLTIMLQRAVPGHAKITRAFVMPETLTLVEHGGDDRDVRTTKKYALRAFVYHQGPSARGGHYWAHVKDSQDGWLEADDTVVRRDRQSVAPGEHDLVHDIDHGYIYTYVLTDEVVDEPEDGLVSGTELDPSTLPAALPAPGHGRPRAPVKRSREPATSLTGGPKGTSAPEGTAPRAAKTIVQCGNMTGDMFIICAALRLDPSLRVRVIWDDVYYPKMYRELARAEDTTVRELFNRNREKPLSEEEVAKELAGRMHANAKRIRDFYVSAGIDESRILVEQSEFPGGAYEDEFKRVKAEVFPDKNGTSEHPTLAVPGYATSTVQREFQRDRVGAQDVVSGMLDHLDAPTRRQVDELRATVLGEQKVVLLWSRGSSRNPGGGNPGLDTDPNVLEQLVDMVRERFPDRVPWIIGDPVPDASPELASWIEDHSLIEYWKRAGSLSQLAQIYFLDQVHRHNEGIAIGMISGALELPALLGMPTFYFELASMRAKGKRWTKMSGKQRPQGGAIPNLQQLEISVDQEYSANVRRVLVQLGRWIASDVPAEAVRLGEDETRGVVDQVLALVDVRQGGGPFKVDPDGDPPWVRPQALEEITRAAARLERARSGGPPALLPVQDREHIERQIADARKLFALTEDELADLASLVGVWLRIEDVDRHRAKSVEETSDEALVHQLRRMVPQAEITFNGASVTINGDLALGIADVRDRLMRDPKWLLKKMKVERPRQLLAEDPLTLPTTEEQGQALATASSWTKDTDLHEKLAGLQEILGPRPFAGLVADLALTPDALPDLLPFVDLEKVKTVVALVGADAFGGMLVEFRGSPGRLVIFVDGLIANRDRLAPPEATPGELNAATILHSRLTMPMHRSTLDTTEGTAGAHELELRPRSPQEQSQVQLVRTLLDEDPDVRAATLGHAIGGGRELQVGLADATDDAPAPATPLGVLPVTADDRASSAYEQLLSELYALQIRQLGRSGIAELADVFFAAAKTRSTPRFATAHQGILDALGMRAGYDMAKREPKVPYAQFFAEQNAAMFPIAADVTAFICTIGGASIEVEPIDTVRLSRPSPVTATMRLADTSKGRSGVRLDERTRVRCTRMPSVRSAELPLELEGVLVAYTHDETFVIETDRGERHTISPDAYQVTALEPTGERMVYASYSIAEVEELFGRTDIGVKLRGLVKRTVAKEVDGIEHFTVEDYIRLITDEGFDAYIVGGAVRDIVSGKKDPADIDIATTMPAIDALSGFEGRRLAHRRGEDGLPSARVIPQHGLAQVEHQVESGLDVVSLHTDQHGVHAMDLVTDARNRDFTFNTLFYDPRTQRVIDPTGTGLQDLEADRLRWTCAAPDDNQDAIRKKLQDDSYQVGRWIKFRIKGMRPANETDVAILNEVFAAHVERGLTPEERARILDGIGKPLQEVIAAAEQLGVPAELLQALAPAVHRD